MRALSFRPSLTLRGRTFKGLRGWAGKPFHPPLTDVPVGAYVLAAAFDVISFLGQDQIWARDFYRAGTFTLMGGAAVSSLAILTGLWDWLRSTKKGTQARRTANAHAWTMVTVTAVEVTEVGIRIAVPKFTIAPARKLVPLIVSVNPMPFGADAGKSDDNTGTVPPGGAVTTKEST